MAYFDDNIADLNQRPDWQILQNGWTSIYLRLDLLNKDLQWFSNEGFLIKDFDCKGWVQIDKLHSDLELQLNFPNYYGKNLEALNDCLANLEINNAGLVIVFRNFQSVNYDYSHKLLDVFANASRRHIFFGKKLLTIIQVNNPTFRIAPVGSCPVLWNRSEWLAKDRGL